MKGLKLEITEICLVDCIDENDSVDESVKLYAKRCYIYNSSKTNTEDAILDYIENFNIDNVSHSVDYFAGECLDSYLESIKVQGLDYRLKEGEIVWRSELYFGES